MCLTLQDMMLPVDHSIYMMIGVALAALVGLVIFRVLTECTCLRVCHRTLVLGSATTVLCLTFTLEMLDMASMVGLCIY